MGTWRNGCSHSSVESWVSLVDKTQRISSMRKTHAVNEARHDITFTEKQNHLIQVSQSAGYCNHMLFIRRMDQEEYTDTVECYSAMKKDKVMPYAETRTDLQIFTLSEVSQAEKETCRMTSLIRGI